MCTFEVCRNPKTPPKILGRKTLILGRRREDYDSLWENDFFAILAIDSEISCQTRPKYEVSCDLNWFSTYIFFNFHEKIGISKNEMFLDLP